MCAESQISHSHWVQQQRLLCHPMRDRGDRIFAMLTAYMDDSGSHDNAPVCVLAGYFGGWRRWLEFEESWIAVLKKYCVKEFHAKRFWAKDPSGQRVDEYRDWTDDKASAFLNELLAIIEGSARIYPFASGVVATEWRKQTIDERRRLTGGSEMHPTGKPSKSVFLALQRCVVRVASYCKPGIKANYFIDSNKQLDAWATICFYGLKENYRKDGGDIYLSMGTLTPDDSRIAVPLQAADLLAYEAREFSEKVLESGKAEIDMMSETYKRALVNMRSMDDFWLFDKPRLDFLSRHPG